eukprot:959428-Amphidinium_carterae.1
MFRIGTIGLADPLESLLAALVQWRTTPSLNFGFGFRAAFVPPPAEVHALQFEPKSAPTEWQELRHRV